MGPRRVLATLLALVFLATLPAGPVGGADPTARDLQDAAAFKFATEAIVAAQGTRAGATWKGLDAATRQIIEQRIGRIKAAFKWIHYLLVLGSAVTAVSGILLLVGSGVVPIGPLVDAADVDGSLIFRNAHFIFALGMVVLLVAHLAGGIMYQRRAGQTFGRMRWPRQSPDPKGQ